MTNERFGKELGKELTPEPLCHEFHEFHEFLRSQTTVCVVGERLHEPRACFRVIRVTRPKIFHFLETNLKMATGVHEHVHVNVNEIRARGR